MKLDARTLAAPLAALAILVLILTQTREALTLSGAWRRASAAASRAPDPFASLEAQLARTGPLPGPVLRDPLRLGLLTVPVVSRNSRPVKSRPPAPPPVPVLTSIVFDADPRATLRWNGRDYSVRTGALFADFRVTNITRDQVTLDRGGKTVVLRLPQRGENP